MRLASMPIPFQMGLLTSRQNTLTGTVEQNNFGSILGLLSAIVILVIILFLAYKTTQLIGKKYGAMNSVEGGIEILDRAMLGQERALIVVRLKGKVILLGVTPHHIAKITDLDPSLYDGANSFQRGGSGGGFASIFMDAIGKGSAILGEKKDILNEHDSRK